MNFFSNLSLEVSHLYQSFTTFSDSAVKTPSEEEIFSSASQEWHTNEISKKPGTFSKNLEIFSNLTTNKKISDQKLYAFMLEKNIKPLGFVVSQTKEEFAAKRINIAEIRGNDFFTTYEAKFCPLLPTELLCLIFSKCSFSTLKNVAFSSKHFSQLSSSNLVWKPIASRLYPDQLERRLKITSEALCDYKGFFKFNYNWNLTEQEKTCLTVLKTNRVSRFIKYLPQNIEKAYQAMHINDPKSFKQISDFRHGIYKQEEDEDDATDFFRNALEDGIIKEIIGHFQEKADRVFKAEDENLSMNGKEIAETLTRLFTDAVARLPKEECKMNRPARYCYF